MQLDWVVDKSQNKMTLELDNVVYETFDGGQNIDKYVDGEFAYRIRQYPDKPRNWTHGNQLGNPPAADLDEWGEEFCLLYTSPSPRDGLLSRMPSSA